MHHTVYSHGLPRTLTCPNCGGHGAHDGGSGYGIQCGTCYGGGLLTGPELSAAQAGIALLERIKQADSVQWSQPSNARALLIHGMEQEFERITGKPCPAWPRRNPSTKETTMTNPTPRSMSSANITALASAFSVIVRRDLADNLDEITKRNWSEKYSKSGACATHDFCDANMLMAEAFESVMGRKLDGNSDDDMALWNTAWSIAKTMGFMLGDGRVGA